MEPKQRAPVLELTDRGIYCAAGDFFIDPWPTATAPAARSIITHGHADHARPNSEQYFATPETMAVMHARMPGPLNIAPMAYGERHQFGDATVSLHSAGHVIGSAQVRVEVDGEVWLVSGDYKRDPDPTCAPFEVVPCDVFITEATFALPAYRWRPTAEVAADILAWWDSNIEKERASMLFCYSFGKAQRVLAELAKLTDRTVYLHGAMVQLVELYRQLGVTMLPSEEVNSQPDGFDYRGAMVVAPPSAAGSTWMRRFKSHSSGFCSGWMRVRGNRRRRGYDRGFVVSDHADWPSLIRTVQETGAKKVYATHGQTDVIVRYLNEIGIDAEPLSTRFGDIEE